MPNNKRFLTGPSNFSRYVFFKSRIHSFPEKYYMKADNGPIQQLKQVENALTRQNETKYEKETEEHFTNIKRYLDFLETTSKNLRSNEMEFLFEQYKNFPDDSELKMLFLEWKEHPEKEIPYDKIINAFNEVLQDGDRFTQSLAEQERLSSNIAEVLSKLDKDELDRLDKLQEEQYKVYVGELFSKMHNYGIDTKEYSKNLTNRLADKANKVLKGIAKNGELINVITNQLSEQGITNDIEIRNTIVNVIMNTIIDDTDDLDTKTLVDSVEKQFTEHIEQTLNSIKDNELERALVPAFKPIEEIALTKKGKSLGSFLFDDLDNTEYLKSLKRRYGKDLIDKILELKQKRQKNEITPEEFNKQRKPLLQTMTRAIKQRAINASKSSKIKKMTQEEFNDKFKHLSNFLSPGKLEHGISTALSSITVKSDSIAEILTTKEARAKIANAIISNLPGVSITYKADVIIQTGSASVDSSAFDGIEIDTIVNNTIKEHYQDFFTKYRDSTGGATNVDSAKKAYKSYLDKMKKALDEELTQVRGLSRDSAAYKKAFEELQNTFSVSISVKDYDVYGNIFGFHGGSLGSKQMPQKVLQNVYDMYETGGLNTIDVEALLFAVLNCGNAMIGSNLRPLLEHYILGAAALMMFDDGFTAIEGYFNNAAHEFTGQKTINIYRLNTKYVPASYVLDGILRDLRVYYQDLREESNLKYGRVTIANNFTAKDMPTGDNAMQQMSEIALSGINISFSFMGGLFDSLEKGPDIKQ